MHGKIKLYRNHTVKRVEVPSESRKPATESATHSSLRVQSRRPAAPPRMPASSAHPSWWRGVASTCYGCLDALESRLDDIEMDDALSLLGLSVDDGVTLRGSVTCLLIALSAHLLIKYVFGRRGIFALIGVGVVLYRIIMKKRHSLFAQMDIMKQVCLVIKTMCPTCCLY